jgi:hypothetical protein
MSEPETPTPPEAPRVVPLVGPRIPADHGLSGLGLIMQLAGTVFAAATSVIGLIGLITAVQFNARFGGADNMLTVWTLALVVTGVVRSFTHRSAGTRLLYDGPGTPLAGIRRYIGIAAIQTVVWVAFYAIKLDSPPSVVIVLALLLAAWPAALAVVISLPRFKRFDDGIPLPEDKGFEGAAILMLILGLVGLGFGLVSLYALLQLPSQFLAQLAGVLLLIIVAMLVIRSALHVVAGWRGVSETHMDRAVEAAGRYADFGVITAFVAGGSVLLMMMTGGADLAGILAVVFVGWILIAWPLIVRRFFSERQFADMLAGGEAPVHRRAPDVGLTSLGWLLLGLGVVGMATALPGALFDGAAAGRDLDTRADPFSMVLMMTPQGFRSPWWSVGTAALQLWAAFELIRMSDHHKLVASIFGVVASAIAVYANLPLIEAIQGTGLAGVLDPREGGVIMLGALAINLIVPVATVVLVNRPTSPTAQARYRTPAPPPAAPPAGP